MAKYKCVCCKKIYFHKSDYKKHENICLKRLNLLIAKFKTYNKINLMNDFFISFKKYNCEICNKKYNSINGIKNHKCLNNQNIIDTDNTNKIISNKNITKIQAKQINNIINPITNNNCNNTNTNITNNYNIKLIPYDDIKYEYMKESVLRDAFEVPGEAFQSITADTFFNPNNKEQHVIFCPNLKDSQIHVYNGNKFSLDGWDIMNKKEFFKEMIKKQMNTLDKIFRCNQEDDNILELKNTIGFKNLLREYNDNDEVIKEYTAKLNTLCYKNNQIIKDTKDTLFIK